MIEIESERFAKLQTQRGTSLARWSGPPGLDVDERLAESFETLWAFELQEGQHFEDPIRFLYANARQKRLEISRRNQDGRSLVALQSTPPLGHDLDELTELGELRPDRISTIRECTAWNALSSEQKIVLREFGPFKPAFLEALLRVADWQGSKSNVNSNPNDIAAIPKD